MAKTKTMKGVTNDQLAKVKAQFEAEGATVTTTKENGTWTVVATWPE